jgi:hypothetical protein
MGINNMAWYLYRQNNSGGSFTVDDKVTIEVWIEAQDNSSADSKAESIGIYFKEEEKS